MPLSFEKSAVLQRLKELSAGDPRHRIFGSQVHQFQLNPPLPLSEVEAFEARHHVSLPLDYRYFLTEIGNGGAGPYYGVFPFGMHDNGDLCRWERGPLVGEVSLPFRHLQAWNLPRSFWEGEPSPPEGTTDEEEDRLWAAWDEKLKEQYWRGIMDGAIPICHKGCALREWLVINGSQHGLVWCDHRADDDGIYPLKDQHGNQMTFSDWYLAWLRDPLRI